MVGSQVSQVHSRATYCFPFGQLSSPPSPTLLPHSTPISTKQYMKGQTDALTKSAHSFRSSWKGLGSVTLLTVRYTHYWCVLGCQVQTGCDITHYSNMCSSLVSSHVITLLLQSFSTNGRDQFRISDPEISTLQNLYFCGQCFDFYSSKKNFTSDLMLILGKPCVFKFCVKRNKICPTPKISVIPNLLFHSTKKSQVFVVLKVNSKKTRQQWFCFI